MGSRNAAGVKWSTDQYRTFNGEHYVHWMYDIPDGRIEMYRAGGVRCRRVKDDLYIRQTDISLAADVDRSAERIIAALAPLFGG